MTKQNWKKQSNLETGLQSRLNFALNFWNKFNFNDPIRSLYPAANYQLLSSSLFIVGCRSVLKQADVVDIDLITAWVLVRYHHHWYCLFI